MSHRAHEGGGQVSENTLLTIAVGLAGLWLAVWRVRVRRRRRQAIDVLSPQWLNERVYDRTGDKP